MKKPASVYLGDHLQKSAPSYLIAGVSLPALSGCAAVPQEVFCIPLMSWKRSILNW